MLGHAAPGVKPDHAGPKEFEISVERKNEPSELQQVANRLANCHIYFRDANVGFVFGNLILRGIAVLFFLLVAAFALHIAFAIMEMDPFEPPYLLKRVIGMKPWVGSWPDDESCGAKNPATDFNPAKARKLTATITRNAGAYNVIMALGFLWCWFPGVLAFPSDNQSVAAIRSFFFGGAVWAGLVGGYTLTPGAYFQALLGAAGLVCIWLL